MVVNPSADVRLDVGDRLVLVDTKDQVPRQRPSSSLRSEFSTGKR